MDRNFQRMIGYLIDTTEMLYGTSLMNISQTPLDVMRENAKLIPKEELGFTFDPDEPMEPIGK